ncbi:hypothetical protein NM688_g1389 [Phlebia brevispora]|uniref:Uncharacterized protein n=1 Tax=Phlebia brevispora TaxID=194682 RepID=A0ACC1TBA7_9APHY|nr:hypothetical protein NM688_g1389 [Phlebia brevispora]
MRATEHWSLILPVFLFIMSVTSQDINALPGPARALIYSATADFRHDSIPTAIQAMKTKGPFYNITFDQTEDQGWFTDEQLAQYDAINKMFTAHLVLDDAGQAALQRYVNFGGNFVAIHAASDCLRNSTFIDREIGAHFDYHPEIQNATVDVIGPSHPSTAMLPAQWHVFDEMYNFKSDPRSVGAVVILSANESSYRDPGPRLYDQGSPHPTAWFQERGAGVQGNGTAGRSWYTSLGHTNATWQDELYLSHVMSGVSWTIQSGTTRATNSSAVVGFSANGISTTTASNAGPTASSSSTVPVSPQSSSTSQISSASKLSARIVTLTSIVLRNIYLEEPLMEVQFCCGAFTYKLLTPHKTLTIYGALWTWSGDIHDLKSSGRIRQSFVQFPLMTYSIAETITQCEAEPPSPNPGVSIVYNPFLASPLHRTRSFDLRTFEHLYDKRPLRRGVTRHPSPILAHFNMAGYDRYDESTEVTDPLLPVEGKRASKVTPLPKLQISILLFFQLAEPITSQCIYPFINQLVSELDITGGDERKVGYYAGLIESLFYATEALFVLQWSRVSDHIGRKPVLLTGVAGLCISMLCFGLSKTFLGLVISRCLVGMLNGNIGVIKCMMTELTDSTNMAKGFAMMPVMWSIGGTVGPLIGGVLSKPRDHWPELFSSTFWVEYPYFLPCAASATFSALIFFVTLIFLKETVKKTPKKRNDDDPEMCPNADNDAPLPIRALLSWPILLSVANYAFLSLLDIAYRAIQPLFYSTPIDLGGLGQSPALIGILLASFGIMNGTIQAIYFPRLVESWGPKRVFMTGMAMFCTLFIIFPITNGVARRSGLSYLVWALVFLQLLLGIICDMAYACIFMYVAASAPNKRSLGGTNGLAQVAASVVRAIGPALSTSLFAASVEHNWLGGNAVYVCMVFLTCLSLLVGNMLPKELWEKGCV